MLHVDIFFVSTYENMIPKITFTADFIEKDKDLNHNHYPYFQRNRLSLCYPKGIPDQT